MPYNYIEYHIILTTCSELILKSNDLSMKPFTYIYKSNTINNCYLPTVSLKQFPYTIQLLISHIATVCNATCLQSY